MLKNLEISADKGLVELRGIEPLTSAVRLKRIPHGMADYSHFILQGRRNMLGTESESRAVAPDEHRTPDALYFVKLPSGVVKIGRSGNAAKRIKGIQTSCPERIEWSKVWEGRGHEERMWHRAFAAQRVHGEWFTWSAELGSAIQRRDCLAAYERSLVPRAGGELRSENARLRKLLYGFVRNRAAIVSPHHQDLLDTLMDLAAEAFYNREPDHLKAVPTPPSLKAA